MCQPGSALLAVMGKSQFTVISGCMGAGRAAYAMPIVWLSSVCMWNPPAHTDPPLSLPYVANTLFLKSIVRKIEYSF